MEPTNARSRAVFITFYSFKGGVGRTMALLNVACILAGRGRRVLMIDFDLEAPGLTLFQQKRQKNQPPSQQPGLVELIHDFLSHPRESPLADQENPGKFREHYVRKLPVPRKLQRLEGGYLDLMPSGRLDETYRQRLYDIRFDRLYEEGIGQPLFKHLKKVIRDSELYDYVLVDSRTGMSDEGSICTRDLADHLVVLTGLNLQNIEGTVHVLRQLKAGGQQGGRVIFVASPVPVHYEELREKRMREARKAIKSAGFKSDLKLRIPYHPRLALDEEPFIYNWSGTDLFVAYETLQGEIRRTAKDTPQDWQGQIRRAVENNRPEEALRPLRELAVERPTAANSLLEWLTSTPMYESAKLKTQAKPFFDLWLTVTEDEVAVRCRFAEVLRQQGEHELRSQELNRALSLANEQGSDADKIRVNYYLAWLTYDRGQLDQALKILDEVLGRAEEAGDEFYAAFAHDFIGTVYLDRGEYKLALNELETALAIWEKLDNPVNEAYIRVHIGNVHEEQGCYKDALRLYEEAYKSQKEMGDGDDVAAAQGELGKIKILLGEVDEGLRLIETANQSLQAMGNNYMLAEGYVDYALGLLRANRVEDAKIFLEQAWPSVEKKAAAVDRAEAYVVRAKVKAALNDVNGAAEDAGVAVDFYRSQRIYSSLAKEAEELASAVLAKQPNN